MVPKFIHSTRASLWVSLTCLRWADHFKHQSGLSGFSHSSTRKPFPPWLFIFYTVKYTSEQSCESLVGFK